MVVIKRLDAQTVANERQYATPGVPEPQGELPAPIRNRLAASRAEVFQQNFGAAFGSKARSSLFEFPAEVAEIVDLAVVGDPVARRLIAHRLAPGGGEV